MLLFQGLVPSVLSSPHTGQPVAQGIRENFTVMGPDGKDRFIRVHLPPQYHQKPQATYPLLLMQDGQNLFEAETAYMGKSWALGATLMDGVQSGKLSDLIAVGIDNANSFDGRAFEYTPWKAEVEVHGEKKILGGGADQYLDWMEKTVLPEIEKRYRVEPGAKNRVIGGASLGALVSLYALVKKPHLFGGAILMSGSWWWNGFQDWLKSNWLPQAGVKLWVDAGEQEPNGEHAVALKKNLTELGFEEGRNLGFFMDPEGRHNEESWLLRVWRPLEYFFKKS